MKPAETGTALALVLAASWAWVAWTTLDMSNPVVELMMPVDASWTWVTVLAVFAMWAGMMVAMMLASAAPMIRTFSAAEQRKTPGTQWATRTALFASAYLFIWTLFSVAATGLQWGLQYMGLLSPMIASRSDALTASLLILAGLYQLTPLKHACLNRCRTPIGFLMAEWQEGMLGAWRMGLKHGLFCAGCCWALMLLLFVAGAMNLFWIALMTVFVALEKWPRLPNAASGLVGIALVVIGLIVAL